MGKSIKKILTGLAMGAVAGLCAAATAPASAKWQRYNPGFCLTEFGLNSAQNAFLAGVGYGGGNYGVMNVDTGLSLSAVCPIDDSSAFTKAEIVTLNVYVHDNNPSGSNFARACTKNRSSFSYNCGVTVQTTSADTGFSTLTPAVTAFTNTSDFAYVLVTLARSTGLNGWSSLNGYYTST